MLILIVLSPIPAVTGKKYSLFIKYQNWLQKRKDTRSEVWEYVCLYV